jgi:hypothetical protein
LPIQQQQLDLGQNNFHQPESFHVLSSNHSLIPLSPQVYVSVHW